MQGRARLRLLTFCREVFLRECDELIGGPPPVDKPARDQEAEAQRCRPSKS
jgi:hypothetical protein